VKERKTERKIYILLYNLTFIIITLVIIIIIYN